METLDSFGPFGPFDPFGPLTRFGPFGPFAMVDPFDGSASPLPSSGDFAAFLAVGMPAAIGDTTGPTEGDCIDAGEEARKGRMEACREAEGGTGRNWKPVEGRRGEDMLKRFDSPVGSIGNGGKHDVGVVERY